LIGKDIPTIARGAAGGRMEQCTTPLPSPPRVLLSLGGAARELCPSCMLSFELELLFLVQLKIRKLRKTTYICFD
jgi:hypothetical protein